MTTISFMIYPSLHTSLYF